MEFGESLAKRREMEMESQKDQRRENKKGEKESNYIGEREREREVKLRGYELLSLKEIIFKSTSASDN